MLRRQKNASALALVSREEPAQGQLEFSLFKVVLGVGEMDKRVTRKE